MTIVEISIKLTRQNEEHEVVKGASYPAVLFLMLSWVQLKLFLKNTPKNQQRCHGSLSSGPLRQKELGVNMFKKMLNSSRSVKYFAVDVGTWFKLVGFVSFFGRPNGMLTNIDSYQLRVCSKCLVLLLLLHYLTIFLFLHVLLVLVLYLCV